nr:MAG TPA: hypothetical protein [Caudoviricetes sp.]
MFSLQLIIVLVPIQPHPMLPEKHQSLSNFLFAAG